MVLSQSLKSPSRRLSASFLAVKLVAESSEAERAKQQSEVTQCDVEVTRYHEQIDYDQCEPGRYHISEDLRLESDPNTGHDFDHTDPMVAAFFDNLTIY